MSTPIEIKKAERHGYGEGYVDGKDKAHFELRNHVGSGHRPYDCGCENCITLRSIVGALARSSPKWVTLLLEAVRTNGTARGGPPMSSIELSIQHAREQAAYMVAHEGLCFTCGCADCDQAGNTEADPMDPPDCSCVGEDGEITC